MPKTLERPVEETAEEITPTLSTADEQAISFLRDRAFDYLLDMGRPARTFDIARAVGEELGLSVADETSGQGLGGLVRVALDTDSRFVPVERMWDLAARRGGQDVDRRKPVERAVVDTIHLAGRPVLPEEAA